MPKCLVGLGGDQHGGCSGGVVGRKAPWLGSAFVHPVHPTGKVSDSDSPSARGSGNAPAPPDDEREFKVTLEIGTGAVLPGGKVGVEYRRKWKHRGERFLHRTLEEAETDESGLAARIASDDDFADLLLGAAQKAALSGNELTHDWLARLVAAAFHDDAEVDKVAFLVDLLSQLQPVHLRVMKALAEYPPSGEGATPEILRESVHADVELVIAALHRLNSVLLAQQADMAFIPHDQTLRVWALTTMGAQLMDLCWQVDASRTD